MRLAFLLSWLFCAVDCGAQVIINFAGTTQGLPAQRLPALSAPIGVPGGLAGDANGNLLIADHSLRLVYRLSQDGILTLVAGNGSLGSSGDGGQAINAALSGPSGIAIDADGNLFIADTPTVPYAAYSRIREVTPNGVISSIDCHCAPTDVAVGGGSIYVATQGPEVALKIAPNGAQTTFASYFQTQFGALPPPPQGIAVYGGNVYLSEGASSSFYVSNRVFKIGPNGSIVVYAGNGVNKVAGDGGLATLASIGNPGGLAFDTGGNLYITDLSNHLVRKVDAQGLITTVAGNGMAAYSGDGGRATQASLNSPDRVGLDARGNLYIGDAGNFRVRKVTPDGFISTVAGVGYHGYFGDGGRATLAGLNDPGALTLDGSGSMYIADSGDHVIRKVSPDGTIRTVAGNGALASSGTCTAPQATGIPLGTPSGIASDGAGNIYFADSALNVVCKLSASGAIQTFAGNGTAGFGGDGQTPGSAILNGPTAVAVDSNGFVYIADTGNNRLRRASPLQIMTISGNGTTRFSGDGGSLQAALNAPTGLAVDGAGNLYVSDTGNNRIRKISNGLITTLTGNGTPGFSGDGGPAVIAMVNQPSGLGLDSAGNLYFADTLNNRIRQISTTGAITTVVGDGNPGSSGDGGLAATAELSRPTAVVADTRGDVFLSDSGNDRVRELLTGVAISLQSIPSAMGFSATSGGANPPPQSLTLSSAISGLPFTVFSNESWLTLNSTSGLAPATLSVSVDTSKLAPGPYDATLTILVPAAIPSRLTTSVHLTLAPQLPPQLSVSAQNLNFATVQSVAPQTAQVLITNTGGGSLAFTAHAVAASGGTWLSLSSGSGTSTPGAPVSLTVTADPTSLAPGTYQGTIVISGAGSSATIPVAFSITPGKPILLLSQSGLSFAAVAQAGAPLPQNFGILNTGTGLLGWSATSTTLSGGSGWLQISPTSGTVNRPYLDVNLVSVAIDPSGLTSGTYYGSIAVTSQAANSPQLLTVVLTVLPVGTNPGIEVRPTGLIFTGVAGVSPGSQDVQVNSVSAQSDNFVTGTTNQRGFTYLPTSAVLAPNQPTTVRVYPDFSTLNPGEIDRAAITLLRQSDGTSQNISVLTVVAPATTGSNGRIGPLATSCASRTLEIQWRSPLQSFSAVLGQPTTVEVQVVDDCGNLIGPVNLQGASVTASFSDKDSAIQLTHVGNGVWTGTWRPVNPTPGPVTISVTAFNLVGLGVLQSGQRDLSGTVAATGSTPTVTAGGVVHAASSLNGVPIAPGSLVSIYGSNLADSTGQASTLPLPNQQNGTRVLIGNLPLPILYTSSGQVNVQVPFDTPVNTQYQISVQRDNVLSVPEQLAIAEAQPGIFTVNEQGNGQGVIFKSDGVTLAQVGTPAAAGETVVIYATGLGVVSPVVAAGVPAPVSPLSTTVNPVTVTIGGQKAVVQFSGLTPGFPGLYQVNATVPNGVSGGSVPVQLIVAGQTSPAVTMAVQ